jgi:hypothetical protein
MSLSKLKVHMHMAGDISVRLVMVIDSPGSCSMWYPRTIFFGLLHGGFHLEARI